MPLSLQNTLRKEDTKGTILHWNENPKLLQKCQHFSPLCTSVPVSKHSSSSVCSWQSTSLLLVPANCLMAEGLQWQRWERRRAGNNRCVYKLPWEMPRFWISPALCSVCRSHVWSVSKAQNTLEVVKTYITHKYVTWTLLNLQCYKHS